jgi:riboflavin biosynthesis pyrimidine reductase
MFMRQLYPTYDEKVDPIVAYRYPIDRPWLRANMVSSLDGSAVRDGRSEGLSSAADKEVFGVLRGLADVVLVGAGTARTEGYRALRPKEAYAGVRASLGQRPAPVLALVSGRLDLDPDSELFHGGAERTVVITHAGADAAAQDRLAEVADVMVSGDEAVDLATALDTLAERGLSRVLCEGGPSLLAAVAAAGRLDELCLTLAPQLVGGHGPRVLNGPDLGASLSLAHLLEQDSVLLTRYVVG